MIPVFQQQYISAEALQWYINQWEELEINIATRSRSADLKYYSVWCKSFIQVGDKFVSVNPSTMLHNRLYNVFRGTQCSAKQYANQCW